LRRRQSACWTTTFRSLGARESVGEQRLLQRIEKLCQAELASKALREQVLNVLRERMGFDAHVFMLTDPQSKVVTSPLADVPMLPWPRLPELIRWRYPTPINRWDRLMRLPASSLLTATRSPSESLRWQHVHRELGIIDSAYVSFGDRYGAWGRSSCCAPARRSPPTSSTSSPTWHRPSPRVSGRPCPGRSSILRTNCFPSAAPSSCSAATWLYRTQTQAAADALLRLNPPDEPMAPIPAAAYNIGAALLAQEQGVAVGEPWARVHLGGSRWVKVKASRLGGDIAVSIEPSTPSERRDLFARSFGLSTRETEVFSLLGAGLESKQIAAVLVLSEHTVDDHVKAILAKTGSRNRPMLLSRALGAASSTTGPPDASVNLSE
jgi:DNA-binding CsgD family transcriptional regulator